MLRLEIVDFIQNFNSQLMELTRFKILEFKDCFRSFVPPASGVNRVKYLDLFWFLVSFAHTNNLKLV